MRIATLRNKILTTLVILCVIPLILTMWTTFVYTNELNAIATKNMKYVGEMVVNETTLELQKIGEQAIRQKAEGVANEIRVFLKYHLGMSFEEMERNEELKEIAVQPVGKTGYTAVHDNKGINHFHVNPKIVGMDLHALADEFPEFWEILERSLREEAWGYYDWKDADGNIRKKFMYCVPVRGFNLTVCATTYIDEFSKLMREVENRVKFAVKNSEERLAYEIRTTQNSTLLIFIVSLLAVLCVGFLLAWSMTKPLSKLRKGIERVRRGDLSASVKVASKDEIGEPASAFNEMMRELSASRTKLEDYSKELEKQVKERTKELEKSKRDFWRAKSKNSKGSPSSLWGGSSRWWN